MLNPNVNLTKVQGSYVHQLVENNDIIESYYYDPEVSINSFRNLVNEVIIETNSKDIDSKSTATKRFLIALNNCKSKESILSLIWNARLSGDNCAVIG